MICPRQKAGMIVIGQLIHGHLQRRGLHRSHMMPHHIDKMVRISPQILPPLVAVFLHPGKKPCERLHKCIVVHHRIPLIALKPFSWISIVLRKDECLRVRLFGNGPEFLPKLVIELIGVSKICRHIKPPAIYVVRRRYPFLCNLQNIFL